MGCWPGPAYAAAGYVALAELPEGAGGVPPRAFGGDLCEVYAWQRRENPNSVEAQDPEAQSVRLRLIWFKS